VNLTDVDGIDLKRFHDDGLLSDDSQHAISQSHPPLRASLVLLEGKSGHRFNGQKLYSLSVFRNNVVTTPRAFEHLPVHDYLLFQI
jgi:hypothetical protein